MQATDNSIPTLTLEMLEKSNPRDILFSGIVNQYYSPKDGFNRLGIGEQVKFVVVAGFGDWALYYGTSHYSDQYIAENGEKVFSEKQIQQILYCPDTIPFYRY